MAGYRVEHGFHIGQWRKIGAEQTMIEQGQKVEEIQFIYNGQAAVLPHGQRVSDLKDGVFVGEMEKAEDKPAVATVKTTTPTRLMAWPAAEIRQLLIRNPSMNSTIQSIFSADLMQKLQRQASVSVANG